MNQDRPTVVVIGGGYGGVNVAKALDPEVEVVLVEPKDAFVHNIGALRAVVDPEFLPKIFFPYDRLLANGRVRSGQIGSWWRRARRLRPTTSSLRPDRRTRFPPRAMRMRRMTRSTTI